MKYVCIEQDNQVGVLLNGIAGGKYDMQWMASGTKRAKVGSSIANNCYSLPIGVTTLSMIAGADHANYFDINVLWGLSTGIFQLGLKFDDGDTHFPIIYVCSAPNSRLHVRVTDTGAFYQEMIIFTSAACTMGLLAWKATELQDVNSITGIVSVQEINLPQQVNVVAPVPLQVLVTNLGPIEVVDRTARYVGEGSYG